MDGNSAWLNIEGLDLDPEIEIVFGMMPAPVVEPEPEPAAGSGDANGDGRLDVDDLTLVIAYVLGDASIEAKSTSIYVKACDLDKNGGVDIDDVSALIYLLLNKQDNSDDEPVNE